jgi:hypothetical protein
MMKLGVMYETNNGALFRLKDKRFHGKDSHYEVDLSWGDNHRFAVIVPKASVLEAGLRGHIQKALWHSRAKDTDQLGQRERRLNVLQDALKSGIKRVYAEPISLEAMREAMRLRKI